MSLLIPLFSISLQPADAARIINIAEGDEWHYFKGHTAPPSHWTYNDFDDSVWQKGSAGFGYGRSETRTLIPDMRSNYKKVHVRRKFSLTKPSKVDRLLLSPVCDGAFIAYINGIEVIRNNSGFSGLQQVSGNTSVEQLDISGFIHELVPGTNVLSIQCENDDINSENFLFDPRFEVFEK